MERGGKRNKMVIGKKNFLVLSLCKWENVLFNFICTSLGLTPANSGSKTKNLTALHSGSLAILYFKKLSFIFITFCQFVF